MKWVVADGFWAVILTEGRELGRGKMRVIKWQETDNQTATADVYEDAGRKKVRRG